MAEEWHSLVVFLRTPELMNANEIPLMDGWHDAEFQRDLARIAKLHREEHLDSSLPDLPDLDDLLGF